jgi:hypothetical protein
LRRLGIEGDKAVPKCVIELQKKTDANRRMAWVSEDHD